MRTGQHKNRNRGRIRRHTGGSNNNGNPLSRIYESNAPDVKVRGTAQTVAEKYLQLGRDAQSAGDNVRAENYYQYAEHYLRLLVDAQVNIRQVQAQYQRDDDDAEENDEGFELGETVPQPGIGDQPFMPLVEGESPMVPSGPRQVRTPRESAPRGESAGAGGGGANGPDSSPRPRSRWTGRRDRPRSNFREGREGEGEPSPRPVQQQAVLDSPAVLEPVATADAGWEAPSFLRRPDVSRVRPAEPESDREDSDTE